MQEIVDKLFELKDLAYKDFNKNLCPGYDFDKMIGVRLPAIKKLAKEIKGSQLAIDFMNEIPHHYFEEYHLHMYLIEDIKDYQECIRQIDNILPFIDNWSTCDHSSPKCLKKNKEKLLNKIKEWLASDHIYTVRFGIKRIMDLFLDADFKPEYLDMVSAIRSDEYYINMMIAWFFATALAKQYEATLPVFKEKKLDVWTHNKAIQKARESYRVSPEQKAYLNELKIK